jgi:hypothetical protein
VTGGSARLASHHGSVLVLLLCACQARPVEEAEEIGADSDMVFLDDRIASWRIAVSEAEWAMLSVAPDVYVPATVEVDGEPPRAAGLRVIGPWDPLTPSLRLRFDEHDPGGGFHGLERVNLESNARDPSRVRAVTALELLRRARLPAPRASLVCVILDGRRAGIYTLVEQVEDAFFEDCFGESGGNLYKLETGATLAWEGEDPRRYDPSVYELKTNEETSDRRDLVDLVAALELTSLDELAGAMLEVLDVDRFLLLLSANTWLSNMDSYQGTGDNLYLYHRTAGRFVAVPWQMGGAFGGYRGPGCDLDVEASIELAPEAPTCGGDRPLVNRLLAVPAFRERYLDHLSHLMEGPLHPAEVERLLRANRELVAEAVDAGCSGAFAADEIDDGFFEPVVDPDGSPAVPGVIPFTWSRDASLRERWEVDP